RLSRRVPADAAYSKAPWPKRGIRAWSTSRHRCTEGESLQWTDINRTRRYTPLAAYAQAMLALTMFTKALADRGFTAVSVDPGTTDREVLRLYGSDAGPSHDAVEAVVRLCAPGFGVLNGAFYEGMLPAPMITGRPAVARLWRLSERLTNLG
ncbi:hypothetical protein ACFPQC_68245, partial [Kibdelosporangium philippinense]